MTDQTTDAMLNLMSNSNHSAMASTCRLPRLARLINELGPDTASQPKMIFDAALCSV